MLVWLRNQIFTTYNWTEGLFQDHPTFGCHAGWTLKRTLISVYITAHKQVGVDTGMLDGIRLSWFQSRDDADLEVVPGGSQPDKIMYEEMYPWQGMGVEVWDNPATNQNNFRGAFLYLFAGTHQPADIHAQRSIRQDGASCRLRLDTASGLHIGDAPLGAFVMLSAKMLFDTHGIHDPAGGP